MYHLWARRVDRRALFIDDEDYRRYVALLAATVRRFNWELLSFCLMPNHIHLLVRIREPNLSHGMQWLQQHYVRYYNDRHVRQGRLFESRFKDKAVTDELYFATLIPYIEQNAVRAGLCAAPEDWPWSSRGIAAAGGASWLADDQLGEERTQLKDGAWPRL
jgi:REP element-mobilizing transposase RayT